MGLLNLQPAEERLRRAGSAGQSRAVPSAPHLGSGARSLGFLLEAQNTLHH